MNKNDTNVVNKQFEADVLDGLLKEKKSLPSKYFYDEKGSQLFEEICRLEEYYPTRTELSIMEANKQEITEAVGDGTVLIEFGSGSSQKTRIILENSENLAAYIPVDISGDFLFAEAERLRSEFPGLDIQPIKADYTKEFSIGSKGNQKRVVYFPGSTVGNFKPKNARRFLCKTAGLLEKGDGLLIGVDSKKSPDVLKRAYDDSRGVTAAFNKNLLHRINRELDADFKSDQFQHKALYNQKEGRVEMHLVSLSDQVVRIGDTDIRIAAGESIHTENSYKYSSDEFIALLEEDYTLEKLWTDDKNWFYLFYFSVKA